MGFDLLSQKQTAYVKRELLCALGDEKDPHQLPEPIPHLDTYQLELKPAVAAPGVGSKLPEPRLESFLPLEGDGPLDPAPHSIPCHHTLMPSVPRLAPSDEAL